METKLIKVRDEQEYIEAMNKYIAIGYTLKNKIDENGITTLVFERNDTNVEQAKVNKPKEHGLYKACKTVGLIYYIIDIVVAVISAIFVIVGIVLMAGPKTQEGMITGGVFLGLGLFLVLWDTCAACLAKAALKNIKKHIVASKGKAVANCIFNIPLGVLMVIIFNKKQANEM